MTTELTDNSAVVVEVEPKQKLRYFVRIYPKTLEIAKQPDYTTKSWKELCNKCFCCQAAPHKLYLDWIVPFLLSTLAAFGVIMLFGTLLNDKDVFCQDDCDDFSVSATEAYYFVFITMTTVGYGDMSPVSYQGRWYFVFLILTAEVWLFAAIQFLFYAFANMFNVNDCFNRKSNFEFGLRGYIKQHIQWELARGVNWDKIKPSNNSNNKLEYTPNKYEFVWNSFLDCNVKINNQTKTKVHELIDQEVHSRVRCRQVIYSQLKLWEKDKSDSQKAIGSWMVFGTIIIVLYFVSLMILGFGLLNCKVSWNQTIDYTYDVSIDEVIENVKGNYTTSDRTKCDLAFYYGIVTSSTVGYGDYYPIDSDKQIKVLIWAIFGVTLWVTMIGIFSQAFTHFVCWILVRFGGSNCCLKGSIHDMLKDELELLFTEAHYKGCSEPEEIGGSI